MAMHVAKAARPWYREPFVWLIVLFPSASVVAGFLMLFLAVKTDDGLVAEDYYKRGLEINQVLDRERKASEREMTATFDIRPEAGRISIDVDGNMGYTPPPAVEVRFLHATRAGLDLAMHLPRDPAGHYSGALPDLAPGYYHVHVNGEDWRLRSSYRVP